MNAANIGQRVILGEVPGGRAFLVGEVIPRPGRMYPSTPGKVWVDWGNGSSPSHVLLEHLAPAPRMHHGHPFVGIEVTATGGQCCATCHVSLWRYSWDEVAVPPHGRPVPAKAL